jgi:hypothetical protein
MNPIDTGLKSTPEAFIDRIAPVSLSAGCRAIDALAEAAADHAALRFSVGVFNPNDDATRTALNDLILRRRAGGFDLFLKGSIETALTLEDASFLAQAGFSEISLGAQVTDVASCLQTVITLEAAGIAVLWRWPLDTQTTDNLSTASLHHLPPPIINADVELLDSSLISDLNAWREQHAPRTLTYSRGPGFLRVFDRRLDIKFWLYQFNRGASGYLPVLL